MLNFFQQVEHDMGKNREELAAGVKGCSERILSFQGLAKSPSMVQGIGLEDYRKDLERVENRAGRSVATVAGSVQGRKDRLREDFRELHARVNAMHSSSPAMRQWGMDIQLRRKLQLIPMLVQILIMCHLTRIIYLPVVKPWKWALSPKLPKHPHRPLMCVQLPHQQPRPPHALHYFLLLVACKLLLISQPRQRCR